MNKVKITEKEVEKIGFDHDRDKTYNMNNQTNEKFKNILQWTAFILGVGTILWLITTLPPEHHNYEVRAMDGTIYHTTRIGHGYNNDRIWFRDENGNSIELGGGYTIIDK
jgi:hypothetical protein